MICGGTILTTFFVLTSATCVQKKYEHQSSIFSIFGAMDELNNTINALHAWATDIIMHKVYSRKKYDNDIALLKMSRPMWQSRSINYVRIASEGPPCQEGYIVNYNTEGKTRADKKVACERHRYLPHELCVTQIPGIPRTTFCSDARPVSKSPCDVFTGSPYMCGYIQYGIVSGTIMSCEVKIPILLTEVWQYRDFIIEVLMSNHCNGIKWNLCCTLLVLLFVMLFKSH